MRKRRAEKRYLKPDPKFNDVSVSKFINAIMYDGKKSVARKVIYDAFKIIEDRTKKPGLEIFKQAIANTEPLIEVKSRRVGGATFQVPTEVRPDRKISLGIKWMIRYAKMRNEKTMVERLAGEIVAASKGEGAAVKKKDDTHRMAEANKAFSHFRF